jgi:tetratricopeptide (TPR) repeat protein
MKKAFVVLSLLMMAFAASAQSGNPKKNAEKMSQRAQGIYYEVENESVADSVRYFRNVMDCVEYSLESDNYDRMPDGAGVTTLRHESENFKRVAKLRPLLIDAGLYLAGHHFRQDGINAWKLYIKASESPLMKADNKNDETALAAFYIAQTSLLERNYKAADRYADIAMRDDDIAQDAAEIKARCMHDQMVTHEDSAKYLSVVAELYRSDPSNSTYFAWLMQFYGRENRSFNLENFIDDQLQRFPKSPIPWILKGETAMHAKRWNEAVDAYKHADELDPKQVPVIYNIGVCLMDWALETGRQGTKDHDPDTKEKVANLNAQARNYLERVQVMDPHRDKVDWVTPLYRIYVMLGDEIKAEELKPLVRR